MLEINVQFVCYECFVGLTSNLILDYSEGVDDLIDFWVKKWKIIGNKFDCNKISFSTSILVYPVKRSFNDFEVTCSKVERKVYFEQKKKMSARYLLNPFHESFAHDLHCTKCSHSLKIHISMSILLNERGEYYIFLYLFFIMVIHKFKD